MRGSPSLLGRQSDKCIETPLGSECGAAFLVLCLPLLFLSVTPDGIVSHVQSVSVSHLSSSSF